MLRQPVIGDAALVIGEQVRAEAGDLRGEGLAVVHGSVRAIESRLVKIDVCGGIDVQDRRRFRRAQVPFRFATGILLAQDRPRYFLAHPLDISAGGIRFSHRIPLDVGDHFRLLLRLKPDLTISPIGKVIETGEHPRPLTLRRHSTTYISRAVFVGLLPPEQILIHSYVKWLLR